MDTALFSDLLSVTTSAPVATNGTLTFPYPSGKAAADYVADKGRIFARGLMAYFDAADDGIDIAFGASITVTYKGETSIPANTQVQLEVFHANGGVATLTPIADPSAATAEDVANKVNQIIAALQANEPPLV
ncbi:MULTISPECIES: hypothetical protein [Chelatococcus]|uniref:Uncharacterized protein n=1 Tax=Chelatococcus caeni TaxID=1348468 RepID=A0A840BYE0_9HYPH|nr:MULTISPECIES: hypothetical protein [Chelatococcus]ALA16082.1 hypothetical protein AL346_00080 [Chelatococcus sp. CO-6]MBB4017583.1 hypothetical protein [Chelatococcus caeni]